MPIDPWSDDEDEKAPRKLGWGCLVALIVTSVSCIIALVLALKVIVATLTSG